MASSQNPQDRKSNDVSTPTSNLSPGEPLWTTRDHIQKSFGQGYDWHEPVSLMKGSVSDGQSLIRFGKFSFKRSMKTTGCNHGSIIDVPITRTEGSQGRFTLLLRQVINNENGVFGTFNTFVDHGYYYCNVDVDMVSLNTQQGVSYDPVEKVVRVTFESGETEKVLKTIIPYRTQVKFLLPDVLRKKITYWIQEYNNIRANRYRGVPYTVTGQRASGRNVNAKFNSSLSYYSNPGDGQNNDKNIKNHWVWYKVYTLPMPISWIRSNVGNPVYIDRWDKNHQYRIVNNTCRAKYMANREDDDTLPDVKTDGYITRYDHQQKLDLVIGKTRYSKFANRMGHGVWTSSGPSFATFPQVYQGDRTYWWVSNDTRITHRVWPEYAGYSSSYSQGSVGGGATMVGILGLKQQHIDTALNNGYGIVMQHDPAYDRVWNRSGAWYYGNIHHQSIPGSWKTDRNIWEPRHIPMPHTGWKRQHSPADTTLNKIAAKSTWSSDAYHGNENIHPETPYMLIGGGGGPDGHDWGGAIPYQDQSWYESQRFSGGVDNTPTSKLTPAFNGYSNGTPHTFPTPVDREFKYGDPLTRIGNLAQPMFNHHGTKPVEYYDSMNQYVMSAEDPSYAKYQTDFPHIDYDYLWDIRRSGYGLRGCTYGRYGRCWTRYSYYYRVYSKAWGPVGRPSRDYDTGDLTHVWVNKTTNATLCAGKLFTQEDAPLSYDGQEYFKGYRYDGASRGVDTSRGSAAATVGYGSAGHGEQGTSRFLYDFRDITHPLSSYEMNDQNLRGYYRCCTDHVNRAVTIVMEPEFPDPPYDLGETQIQFLINKGSEYDTYKAAEYDDTVLVDHTINAGPTFRTNDEWDQAPTGPSVTDRLFTSDGALPTNPVLFLGVSAGNLPGGSMESSDRVVIPTPSRTIMSGPTNGENFNADKLVDTVSRSADAGGKTYTYTFTNRGESPSIVSLGVTYQRQQGPYTPRIPATQNSPEVPAAGDKIADWSYNIQTPYTPGNPEFPTNTFQLSAGEVVSVNHVVTPTTDVTTGYIIKQTVTIEESSGKTINKQLVFDVDVTA